MKTWNKPAFWVLNAKETETWWISKQYRCSFDFNLPCIKPPTNSKTVAQKLPWPLNVIVGFIIEIFT